MNLVDLPQIAEFIRLVKVTDEDADHRLLLVERAAPFLYDAEKISDDERLLLAEKFERWRYQRLNKFSPRLSENERRLIDALDLAAGKIFDGRLGIPKSPRSAIHAGQSGERLLDRSPQANSIHAFAKALDPRVALKEITSEAAAVTSRHFCSQSSKAEPHTDVEPRSRWRMRLYAPLYLSNYCVNHCLYCAFRFPNELDRVHLSVDEALAEAEVLRAEGHRHLLVVAGDFPKLTSVDYLVTIIRELVAREFSIAVEVAPQSTVAYAKIMRAGACGVTLYQETYQEEIYRRLHPRGPKMWFDWRLEALERAAEAGIKRLGLGILLGLADPAVDVRCLIRHGQYLLDRFPDARLAFSLPRIHEAPDSFKSGVVVDDETLIRLFCGLRFSFATADLVLSTREAPALRDQLAEICITQMSAGSCTAPGGYTGIKNDSHTRQQFPVFDHRTTSQVADVLERSGFDLIWDVDDD